MGLKRATLRAALQMVLTGTQPIQQQLQISDLHKIPFLSTRWLCLRE